MKLNFFYTFSLAVVLTACAGSSSQAPSAAVTASNAREIHIAKPYDWVYLQVFDTINNLKGWAPDKTLMDEGLIRVRNTEFTRLDDASNRVIAVRIRRDNSKETTIFLEQSSQRVIGADEVLDAIRRKLGVS